MLRQFQIVNVCLNNFAETLERWRNCYVSVERLPHSQFSNLPRHMESSSSSSSSSSSCSSSSSSEDLKEESKIQNQAQILSGIQTGGIECLLVHAYISV